MPIARPMGPATAVFATLMGPPNRQGHGATRRVTGPKFARVMGPPSRHPHGATPGGGRRGADHEDREQGHGAARRRRGTLSGSTDELSGVDHDRHQGSASPPAGGAECTA